MDVLNLRHSKIDKYSKPLSDNQYYYKECAINARSPENEADPIEVEFLQEINRNENLEVRSDVRFIDGGPFFVVLRRGEVLEDSCLRCHSKPERASADLVKQHGPQRSLDRRAGEVVSAVSIRIPLASAYGRANRFFIKLSIWLSLVLSGLYIVNRFFNRALLLRPLNLMLQKVAQITSSPDRLGDPVLILIYAGNIDLT